MRIFLVVTESIVGVLASPGVEGGKEREFKEDTKVCVFCVLHCVVRPVASVLVYHLDCRVLGKQGTGESKDG